MTRSAWRVTDHELTPSGRLYTVVLGQREWRVIHAGTGWQAWNGHARCEMNPAVKAAVLDYEREHPYDPPKDKFTTTLQDIADRQWTYENDGWMEW